MISALSATSCGLWESAISLGTFLVNPSAQLSAVLTKTTSTTPCSWSSLTKCHLVSTCLVLVELEALPLMKMAPITGNEFTTIGFYQWRWMTNSRRTNRGVNQSLSWMTFFRTDGRNAWPIGVKDDRSVSNMVNHGSVPCNTNPFWPIGVRDNPISWSLSCKRTNQGKSVPTMTQDHITL